MRARYELLLLSFAGYSGGHECCSLHNGIGKSDQLCKGKTLNIALTSLFLTVLKKIGCSNRNDVL